MRRLVCILFVAASFAGETAELDALLPGLSAPDAPTRLKTTAELVEACDRRGMQGRIWLERAEDDAADPEVRKRLAVVRRELDLRQKVKVLLDSLRPVGLPDASKAKFVKYVRRFQKGYGWRHGDVVVDVSLRETRFDRTEPAKFGLVANAALERSRAARLERADKTAGLDRLALHDVCFALWSWQRGDKRLAIEFLREANRVLRHMNTVERLSTFIRARTQKVLVERAIQAAADGESRPALVARWQAVLEVDGPGFIAHDYLRAYRSLIEEDKAWRAPAERGPAYWIHRLRDSHATPRDLGPAGDPARRIEALGWDAVPALIARLQDTRPTRGLVGKPPRLVTHADMCEALLERISGEQFRSRGRAEDWWRAVTEVGLDAYLLAQLNEPHRRATAAGQLLRRDAAKHGKRIEELAWKHPRLLPLVADRLRPADKKRLLKLLPYEDRTSYADRRRVLAVVRVLWDRYEDDRGVRMLLQEIEFLGDSYVKRDVGEIEYLCRCRAEAAVLGIEKLLRRGSSLARSRLVGHIHHTPDPRLLDALLHLTRDRVSWAETDRLCDRAAVAAARMIRLEGFGLSEEPAVRNAELDRFVPWVEKRRASIDWDNLRR